MSDILVSARHLEKRNVYCVIGMLIPEGRLLFTTIVDNAGIDEMEYIGIARAMQLCVSTKKQLTIKINSTKAYNWWLDGKRIKSNLMYNNEYSKMKDFVERSHKYLLSISEDKNKGLMDFASQEDNHKWTPMFTRYFLEEDMEINKVVDNETDKEKAMRERNQR